MHVSTTSSIVFGIRRIQILVEYVPFAGGRFRDGIRRFGISLRGLR